MIAAIALRRLWRQLFALSVHAGALGVAVFILGMTATVVRSMGEPMVLGASCPSGARRLSVDNGIHAGNVRYAFALATSFHVAGLQTVRRESTHSNEAVTISLYEKGLFEALCFDISSGRAPNEGSEYAEAFVHTAYPWADLRIGETTQIGYARFDAVGGGNAFVGVGSGLAPAVWIPASYGDLLGVTADEGEQQLWVVPRQRASWDTINQEMQFLYAGSDGRLGDHAPELVPADERTNEQQQRASRGAMVMAALSAAIAITVCINLLTFFAAQQPAYTAVAGVLHMLGAPRERQFAFALSEPLAIAAGGLVVAALCHRVITTKLIALLGDASMLDAAWPVYAIASMAIAAALAWRRVHHVASVGRTGVVAARRMSARLYPGLLGVQLMLAVMVLAMAAISVLQWNAVRPGQYVMDVGRVWHVRFDTLRTPTGLADRLVAAKLSAAADNQFDIAFATLDAPLVQYAVRTMTRAANQTRTNPDDLEATVVYATEGWLSTLGLAEQPLPGAAPAGDADQALVNQRFLTARWPEGVPAFPYVVIEAAPVRSTAAAPEPTTNLHPREDVFLIRGYFNEKGVGHDDRDDLLQPTVVLPIHRYPIDRPFVQIRALMRTPNERDAAWVRAHLERVEAITGLRVAQVLPARAVQEHAVASERARAISLMQLAFGTLFVALSGMVALCAAMAASMRRELATRFSIGWSRRATVLLMLTRMTRPMAVGAAAGTLGAFGVTMLMIQQTPALRQFQIAALALTLLIVISVGVMAVARPVHEAARAVFAQWLRDE